MKRKLSLGLSLLFTVSMLVACGSKTSEETKTTVASTESSKETNAVVTEVATTALAEPLNLTGLWIQEDHEKSYMAATIKDDGMMGVFFILDGDEKPYTYWVGTYVAPTEDTNKYEWTSENTYAGNGILSSSDDTKKFIYDNGKISYKVTIQGQTKEVSLVKGDWNVSAIPDSAFGSVRIDSIDFKPLEIKDSGWTVSESGYMDYYVTIYNPNEDVAVEYPSFRITAKDANGALIDTTDQTLSIIYPQREFTYGSQAFSVDETPATVEFEMKDIDDSDLKRASSIDEYKELEVVNGTIRNNKIVGEIHNPNNYPIETAYVLSSGRNSNDEVISIESTCVDELKPDSNTPFSISLYSGNVSDISSTVFYSYKW